MTTADHLLGLQEIDSAIDQCGHRRTRLMERTTLAEADAAVKKHRSEIIAADKLAATATTRIEALEHENAARDTKKKRLDAQLKTVIAPREAEALMHEMSLLDEQRSVADDEELECMDALEAAETARATADTALAEATTAQAAAQATLAAAEAALDAEVAELSARRAAVAAVAGTELVAEYERLRKSFGGIAISRLHGTRCGACHLDQSSKTMETIKAAVDGEPSECEQCGRLLVA
jgi:uncharacterized protein